MNSCCAATDPASVTTTINCPECGSRGASVELCAVKALLVESALARLECLAHRFCRAADCLVVYYDESGRTYLRDNVRVRVWHKEPAGNRTICYCFGESETAIRDELCRTGSTSAVARIKAHIEAGRCACDVRNPRGVCCLGDLTLAVERVGKEALLERHPA
jgi:hypothetical protein